MAVSNGWSIAFSEGIELIDGLTPLIQITYPFFLSRIIEKKTGACRK